MALSPFTSCGLLGSSATLTLRGFPHLPGQNLENHIEKGDYVGDNDEEEDLLAVCFSHIERVDDGYFQICWDLLNRLHPFIRNSFGLASRESATPSVSPMMTGTCGLTLSTPWSLFEITTEAPREQSNSTRFKLILTGVKLLPGR